MQLQPVTRGLAGGARYAPKVARHRAGKHVVNTGLAQPAEHVDKEVVLDGHFVTSRYWMDNAHLLREFLKMLKGR